MALRDLTHDSVLSALQRFDELGRSALIHTWFYPCSHAMHRGLGEMYVADQRFTETYERRHPGLARFLSSAIVANAQKHGA